MHENDSVAIGDGDHPPAVPPAPARRRWARRPVVLLCAGMIAGAIGTASVTAIATRGDASSVAATSAEAAGAVDAPPATTTTTAATTTTTAPTRPEDTVPQANAAWPGVAASLEHAAGPDLVGGRPYAVGATGATVTVWEWDGTSWAPGPALTYNGGAEPYGSPELAMGDVTGDGSAEIAVTYYPGNDSSGEVFHIAPDGLWWSVPFDHSPVGISLPLPEAPKFADGVLTSVYNTCWPSCAEGALLDVGYEWDGAGFVARSSSCERFRVRDHDPDLGICDAGEMVREAQEALIYFEYLRGSADGNYGLATKSAVARFQRDYRYSATGYLTGEQPYVLIEDYHRTLYGDEYYG